MQSLIEILTDQKDEFHPVVSFDPKNEKLVGIDLTASNQELSEEVFMDTQRFSIYVDSVLQRGGARYAIGGYGEDRIIYKRSANFESNTTGGQPRTLHLGLDIWGVAGTSVYCPLPGKVHSFAYNDQFADYGATIILEHQLAGLNFYTLYGHLSLVDLNISEGFLMEKGTPFAHFGKSDENGSWPPHLHFQIIRKLQGRRGDYPGVCSVSQKDLYLHNCPDPDIIAQMFRYL